ncbi:MAG: BLUF domain-containing protein [Granulosicoccus sp.]|nr:BLUF domain-containing protein [Granulosicoccus sp.]
MISLAYTSESVINFTREMFEQLHETCESSNRKHGVTGYLSWRSGRFFQYIEGPEDSIEDLMVRVQKDDRHKVLHILNLGTIDQRRFSSWDMLNINGVGIPDIRIADLVEDVMTSTIGNVFAEEESRRLIIEILDQMSKLHQETVSSNFQEYVPHKQKDNQPFVVTFGASAGGLKPLQKIVRSLDNHIDAAFIIIQHDSPSVQTVKDMALQRETKMKVCAAANGMRIECNCIYVVPPGENLEISHGRFVLVSQQRSVSGPQYPIDICFRSIAREYGDRAIAVVLSGEGSDGLRGAKVLNEAGGIVLVQSPRTAEFDSMPKLSIEAGMAHQVLAPVDIAAFINSVDIENLHQSLTLLPERRVNYVQRIVSMLDKTDVDFTQYKSETLFRRIERRRLLANIDSTEDYVELLLSSEQERVELRNDILVDSLKAELDDTKKALQTAINDLESSNDGQRIINEQLAAANEELQSTNEELLSVNEELQTVNFEYQTKIQELSELNQDLDNLLSCTNLGVIFLDSKLNILRFTEFATKSINLLPSDIGRPFEDLAHHLPYGNLVSDLRRVLSIGKPVSREIVRDGTDQLEVSIHSYRAGQALAQGVLITFRDIKTKSVRSKVTAIHEKSH